MSLCGVENIDSENVIVWMGLDFVCESENVFFSPFLELYGLQIV